MKRLFPTTLIAAVALFATLLFATQQGDAKTVFHAPRNFFGITPQTAVTPQEARWMKAGGIGAIRVAFSWADVQPTARSKYDWSSIDPQVETAARAGLQVLASLGSPPAWATHKGTTMPIDNAKERNGWSAFLRAAVKRYGPGGEFWAEHATEGVNYEPAITAPVPIRTWQVWNESNFFYFAYPVSPRRYGKLVTISSQAIKQTDPSATVVLSGLFGQPTAKGKKGMPAATFLDQLYRYPGIKSRFDGVSLHPYAVDTETLEELVEEFHQVSVENHDRPGFYITEMGWGSQNDFQHDAFEQGIQGQARQLRDSYEYLLSNQHKLNLKQVFWFSWKDAKGLCDFCDSVGLFREGTRFKPKPAWRALVSLTGGRARP